MTIGYGSCVGSWGKLNANVVPRIGSSPLMALSGQTSISKAYNSILDAYSGRGLDAVILIHDDLEITDDDHQRKVLDAFQDPTIALVGCDGSTDYPGLAWWNGTTLGYQMTDSGICDFRGESEGDALFIEGSFMCFSPWAVENLRFDERYTFLGYDDICMAARMAGKRTVVRDIATHHHSTMGFKSPAIERSWRDHERLFEEKWGLCESS